MKEKIKKIITDITLERVIKLSIVLAILLVGFAIFYHYVIFLPQKEETRLKQEKQAKEETEQALNTCIADAEKSYSNQWYKECKGRGALTGRCISLHEMTFDEYVEEENIPDDKRLDALVDFYKEKNECSCRLPLDLADRVNKSLQDDKDECFKRYPQK